MKSKKILLTSIGLIFLFMFATATNADTGHTVEYPSTVRLGDLFTMNIIFDYEVASDCLFSMKVYFYFAVNDVHTTTWANGISKYVSNAPRPTNISWTLDTSIVAGGLEVGDIFKFRFIYKMGVEDAVAGYIQFLGIIVTDTYEITIGEPKGAGFDFAALFIGFTLIAIAVTIIRRKRTR